MELFEFIFQYIPLDYVLIVGGLIVIGEMLKKFTVLPNQLLTTALPVLGAVIMGIIYSTGASVFEAAEFIKQICVGLLMGWASTGGYEWFRNTFLVKVGEKKVIAREIVNIEKENEEAIIEETNETSEEAK
jgi:hypothetical protein